MIESEPYNIIEYPLAELILLDCLNQKFSILFIFYIHIYRCVKLFLSWNYAHASTIYLKNRRAYFPLLNSRSSTATAPTNVASRFQSHRCFTRSPGPAMGVVCIMMHHPVFRPRFEDGMACAGGRFPEMFLVKRCSHATNPSSSFHIPAADI